MAAVPREFYDIEDIPPHDSPPNMYKLPRDLAVSIIYMILKLFTFEKKYYSAADSCRVFYIIQ